MGGGGYIILECFMCSVQVNAYSGNSRDIQCLLNQHYVPRCDCFKFWAVSSNKV